MLSRRDALRGGTATVAAIAAAGAVAGAAVPTVVTVPSQAQLPATADESLVAMADEMRRAWQAYCAADEDDPTRDQYLDRFNCLDDQVRETPAHSLKGILAKYRAHYSPEEEAAILAGQPAWDSPDEDLAVSIYLDLLRLTGEAV